MDTLLRRLGRYGLRQGLSGGHWAWVALAVGAYALRRARRPPDDAISLPMEQGDRFEVTLSPPGRRGGGRPPPAPG